MSIRKSPAVFAALMMAGLMTPNRSRQDINQDYDVFAKEPFIPKGCKAYEFGGVTVIARTYEKAVKKAKKRGLL